MARFLSPHGSSQATSQDRAQGRIELRSSKGLEGGSEQVKGGEAHKREGHDL